MNRNNFLMLIFSFCPGAGQMYQGYMKRGLSMVLLFVAPIMVGAAFMPMLSALAAVVYMYSFFDSLNLHAQLKEGNAPKDDYVVHLNLLDDDLKRLMAGKSHLVGWAFVALGVSGLYKTLVEPILLGIMEMFPWGSPVYVMLSNIVYGIPGLCIGVGFILVGVWLIRGDKKNEDAFEEYKGDDHE